MRKRFAAVVALVAAAVLGVVGVAVAQKPAPPPPVTIQLLNVSDWHGYLDPTGSPSSGGAWNISARWQADRQAYPTLTLTAGDDFGASPALASFFDEAPAVKAERMMGIQVNTFGNHNFDEGVAHLQTMIDLAGAPTSADAPGAPYTYVAANLKNLDGNLTGVDPIRYFDVGGAKVAVIGIVNEEAPGLVLPGSFGSIEITDGADAANKYARIARQAKADAVIVITHKGVRGVTDGQPFGELVDFANRVDSGLVDVVVGDHTDVQYGGTVNGILITENRSFGQTYAKTLLKVQPGGPGEAGSVLERQVSFVTPSAGALPGLGTTCPATGFCDQALVDMLVPYRVALRQKLDAWVGTTTQPYDRGGNIERRQEVPEGDLIADGMRWKYGTQLALMNSGGIRSQLPACNYTPADHTLRRANWDGTHTAVGNCTGYDVAGPPYDIVLGDIYTTLPFGNVVTVRTVTGAQLWAAMENGVSAISSSTGLGTDGRFPQISGFKFTFHYGNAPGSRVTSMTLDDGTPIPNSTSATYSIALPNFTNAGGDSYTMFADGQGVTKDLDAAVIVDYINAIGPNLDPTAVPLDRITKLP